MTESAKLSQTWKDFKHALLISKDPFNPWYWIYRLASAAVKDYVQPLAPIAAMFVVCLVALSYVVVLRHAIVQQRWCPQERQSSYGNCAWLVVHDFVVVYLFCMTLFHLRKAAYTSPGILPTTTAASLPSKTAMMFDQEVEEKRLGLYGPLVVPSNIARHPTEYPSQDPSWCRKCQAIRPPRCHHCRQCGVCVFEYDHHCILLNNCVGYYNYRSFFLTVFFLTLSCWYGILSLYLPFYEPLRESLRQHGGSLIQYLRLYWEGKLDDANNSINDLFWVPPSVDAVRAILAGESRHHTLVQLVIDVVFPLLFSVGSLLAFFLGMHVKFTLQGLTTLEYKVKPNYNSNVSPKLQEEENTVRGWMRVVFGWVRRRLTDEQTNNPFDQGSPVRNWTQRMGSNPLLLLIPLSFVHNPPCLPNEKDKLQ